MLELASGVSVSARHTRAAGGDELRVQVVVDERTVRGQIPSFDGSKDLFVAYTGKDGRAGKQNLRHVSTFYAGGSDHGVHEAALCEGDIDLRAPIDVGVRTNAGILQIKRLTGTETAAERKPREPFNGVMVVARIDGTARQRYLDLRVTIEKKEGRQLDGVVARVPHEEGDQTVWQEHPLQSRGSYSAGHIQRRHFDIFELRLDGIDLDLVDRLGIEVKADSSQGLLPAQPPGETLPVVRLV